MFWLRHKTVAATTWTQVQFEGLSILDYIDVTRINGETLRGNDYSHKKAKKRTWDIVITADETATHAAFLRDFWAAEMQQISLLTSPSSTVDNDGILVTTEGGREPREYIDGLVQYTEYTLSLREAQAS